LQQDGSWIQTQALPTVHKGKELVHNKRPQSYHHHHHQSIYKYSMWLHSRDQSSDTNTGQLNNVINFS
jgi:hypothetical protein